MKATCLALVALLSASTHAQESADPVAELITEGRDLLDAYDPDAALSVFERARDLDGGAQRAERWILRTWMDQGRGNDTLDALDALRASGAAGSEIDYLYGMAFTRRAQTQIAQGVKDTSIEMNFRDASELLSRVTESEPARFTDAHLALATSAWYTQELGLARRAGESAVEYRPNDGRAWLQLGRIAMSQFRSAFVDNEWNEEAEAHWAAAQTAFERAVQSLEGSADATRLADAATQLGHVRMWKAQRSAAADAYAIAIAWAPEAVDYSQLHSFLSTDATATDSERVDEFNRALEDGARRFIETFGAADTRDSTLQWWLGWSRLDLDRPLRAEAAFLHAVEEAPEFVNSWFYIALARIADSNPPGASEALIRGWEADPSVIIAEMQGDLAGNAAKVSLLIDDALECEELLECAVLAEICAEAEVTNAYHWNNLGLFLRDAADAMRLAHSEGTGPAPDSAELDDLHERSFAAYERALELAPDDASVVNDTAVLLHYYLDRNLGRAFAMYARAAALAQRVLDDPETSDEDWEFFEVVLTDAQNNRDILRHRIARHQNRTAVRDRLAHNPPL